MVGLKVTFYWPRRRGSLRPWPMRCAFAPRFLVYTTTSPKFSFLLPPCPYIPSPSGNPSASRIFTTFIPGVTISLGPAGPSPRNLQPLTRRLAAWNQFQIHAGPRIHSLPRVDTRLPFSIASPLVIKSSPALFVGARYPRYLRGLGIGTRGACLFRPSLLKEERDVFPNLQGLGLGTRGPYLSWPSLVKEERDVFPRDRVL